MISAITVKLLLVLLAVALMGFLIGLSGMRLHHSRSQNKGLRAAQNKLAKLTAERTALASENAKIKQALESEQKLAGFMREKQSQLAAQQETLQVHSGLQEQRIEKMTTELNTSEEKCIRLQRDFASFKANKLREVRMLKVSADEWLDNEELPVLNKKVEPESSQHSLSNSEHRSASNPSTLFGDLKASGDLKTGGLQTSGLQTSGLKAPAQQVGSKAAERSMSTNSSIIAKSTGLQSSAHRPNESIEPEEIASDVYQPSPDETQPIIASELDIPSLAESELPDSVEELEFELVEQNEPD